MSAFREYVAKRYFLLNEEKLRKIHSIINTRLDPNQSNISYKVFRSDNFVFETKDVDDIIKEDNSDWQKIIRITVTAEDQSTNLKLNLEFDSNRDNFTKFNLEGDKRDLVFLLSGELKDYLSNEVDTIRNINVKFDSIKNIVIIILAIIMSVILINLLQNNILYNNTITPEQVKQLQASDDINAKVNYIIDSLIRSEARATGSLSSNGSQYFPILFIVPLVLIILPKAPFTRLVDYLIPANIFLFGKQQTRYKDTLDRNRNIFWGVIVATVISLITGMIIWYITSSK